MTRHRLRLLFAFIACWALVFPLSYVLLLRRDIVGGGEGDHVSLESLSWLAMETMEKSIKGSFINYRITHVQPTDRITASLREQCERGRKLIVFVQLSRTGAGAMMKHLFKAPDIVEDDSDNRYSLTPAPGEYERRAAQICAEKCVLKGFVSSRELAALRAACAAQNRRVVTFTSLRHPIERAYSLYLWPSPDYVNAFPDSVGEMAEKSPARLARAQRNVVDFFRPDNYSLTSEFFQTFFNNSMLWQLGYQRHASERNQFNRTQHCSTAEAVHECLHRRSLELLRSLDFVGSYEDLKHTFTHLTYYIFPRMSGTLFFQLKFLAGTVFGYPYNHVLKHQSHLSKEARDSMKVWLEYDLKLWREAMSEFGINRPFTSYVHFICSVEFFIVLVCFLSMIVFLISLFLLLLLLVTMPLRFFIRSLSCTGNGNDNFSRRRYRHYCGSNYGIEALVVDFYRCFRLLKYIFVSLLCLYLASMLVDTPYTQSFRLFNDEL